MFDKANKLCERLWKDESGVVLALTVVVFLSLFLMTVSVYAVGENIRQRIALQNAVDAAAYSGAVVQADALSRLAILNQAMSWEYAQLCKTEMDYIIGKWAARTANEFRLDPAPDGRVLVVGDWTGAAPPYQPVGSYLITDVFAAEASFIGDPGIVTRIEEHRSNVELFSGRSVLIQEYVRTNILQAVHYVLQANLAGDSEVDLYWASLVGDGRNPMPNGLVPVLETEDDEVGFFQFCGIGSDQHTPLGSLYFGPGWKTWYDTLLMPLPPFEHGFRDDRVFRATWVGFSGAPHTCSASDVADGYFRAACAPQAKILTPDYFAKSGAVSVGVSRKQRNPFEYYNELPTDRSTSEGFFTVFNLGVRRTQWAVATARAGVYRDSPEDVLVSRVGYDPHAGVNLVTGQNWLDSRKQDYGNLANRKWDAVLIPLRRAWAAHSVKADNTDEWGGDTTGEVLKAFASQLEWVGLFATADPASKPMPENTYRLGWGETIVDKAGIAAPVALDWDDADALGAWVWH